MKFRTRYDNPVSVAVSFSAPSLAQQHLAVEADINHIVAKYHKTGYLVDPLSARSGSPLFGDFSTVCDYDTAIQASIDCEDHFMALPSNIRARFRNSPQLLMEFLADENNYEEAVSLGLVKPKVVDVLETEQDSVTPGSDAQ